MLRFYNSVAVAAIVTVLASATAQAQNAPGQSDDTNNTVNENVLEGDSGNIRDEIIVTATKSGDQTLQEVPLAIQVFDGESMRFKNITDLASLTSSVPGLLEGQNQSVASRSYNLRGAGGSNANGDSPIGYYVDDVPFVVPNFGIAPPIRFIDIDRVEVLRGPHGTLYGQGSAGGVFVFHSKDPDLEEAQFAAEAFISTTNDASGLNTDFAGVVSLPIIKNKLAIRVSGGISKNQGFADQYFGPFDGTPDREDVNVVRNDDIRAVVLFEPTDNISLRGQIWKFRPRQQFLGALDSVDPPYEQDTGDRTSFGNGDFSLYSLTANIDLGDVALTSSTSFMKGEFGIFIPIGPQGFFSSQFFPEGFTQEVRANSTGDGPLHWVVGGQYSDSKGPQENQLLIVPILDDNADNNTLTKNWAVFGEVSYDLFDGKLVPLVGLRQYHDKRIFEDRTSSLPSTENITTWRVNLSYVPTDNFTTFGTVATGFRAGIVQSRLQSDALIADGVPAGIQLKPESYTNYEVGIKWRTSDDSVSVGLNAYYSKIDDQMTSVQSSIPNVGGFANFGTAKQKGLDFEVQWRTPIEGLHLSVVGNVNDGEYGDVNPAVQIALPQIGPGSRLVNSIESSYRLNASYTTSLSNELDGFGNISFSHSGDRLGTDGLFADPYNMVNGTIGIRKGPFEISLVANNLFDERGPTTISQGNPNAGVSPVPRTFGIRLRADFQN
ncbi:MAG: TonB-dependent receptor [Alphaproteobacteria bacterium]|nr:MAG: TonB-dependent receptor [Alphaproteobacteria bacterium]